VQWNHRDKRWLRHGIQRSTMVPHFRERVDCLPFAQIIKVKTKNKKHKTK
jgi:hypothetical protein